MKLGFMGTPAISAELLKALIEAGHEIAFVVSNPDRPKGRSGNPVPSAVSEVALREALPLFRPEKPAESLAEIREMDVDAVVVFAYGSILPDGFLTLGRFGIFNLHGSLLPLLRGASPIQSAILQGFASTGWTFQFVSQKMDCGDIVSEVELEIDPEETAGELTDRMVPAGIQLVLGTLGELEGLASRARPQDPEKATYCKKILPNDSYLDWNRSALELHNQIRGMNPRPVARTMLGESLFKIHRSRVAEITGSDLDEKQLMARAPGDLLSWKRNGSPGLYVVTGNGVIEILQLQPQNKKTMDAASFLNGYKLQPNARFELPVEN